MKIFSTGGVEVWATCGIMKLLDFFEPFIAGGDSSTIVSIESGYY